MKKKIIVATLVGIMALGTLAGCAGNKPTEDSSAVTTPAPSESTPDTSKTEVVTPTEIGEEFPY